jgi:hypothetical protein
LGVAALDEAISAGMPLDKYSTIVKVYQKAGMISPRAMPTPPNKKKDQEDGSQSLEICSAPDGNEASRPHPGACEAGA